MKTTVDLEDYLDAEVMDVDGKLAGSLRCFWTDDEGTAIFLGIKTSWNTNTVVVPVALAEANEYHSCVVIHVPQEQLRAAPSLSCDEALSPELEDRLYDLFQVTPPTRRPRPQINSAATRNKLHPN